MSLAVIATSMAASIGNGTEEGRVMKTEAQIIEQIKVCIANAQTPNVEPVRQLEAQTMARTLKWVLEESE